MVPLAEVCDLEIGRTPARDEARYWGPGHPWLSIADMKARDLLATKETITDAAVQECRCRMLPAGTVVLSFKLSVGKVGILRRPMFTNEAIAALRLRRPSRVGLEYMYHALRAVDFTGAGERAVKGVTLNLDSLAKIRIPVPPHEEQRRIAALLDRADALQAKRQESLRLLDEFLRSAFLEMFGDPVRNEKGWAKGVIGDVTTDTQYGTSAKANSEGLGLPVLRMGNITVDGAIDLSDMKWCEIAKPDLAAYTVRRGDLLFNRTNSPELVGKTAVWDRDDSYAFAGYLVRVRFDEARVLPEFVSAYLNSAQGKRMLFFKAKPSNNMSNISASEFRRLPIPLPPPAEQRRFVAVAAKAKQSIERGRSAETVAATLFDSLAQGAFGGTM